MSIATVSTNCDDMEYLANISPRSSWSELSTADSDYDLDSDYDAVETTVMVRHIPCKYSQEALMEEVLEFSSNFDYFYLPPARTAKIEKNLGYAFINFKSLQEAEEFTHAFQGYQFKLFPNSLKRATVNYAELQGKEANLESYRKSKCYNTKFVPWVSQY
jgi:hypothetical protein